MLNLAHKVKKGLFASTILMASTPLWAAEHWIDVRTPEQFQAQHVDGAINVPLKQLDAKISEVTTDKNDTLHLYCNSGYQSGKAETLLQKMGYKNAVNEGGLDDVAKTQNMVK